MRHIYGWLERRADAFGFYDVAAWLGWRKRCARRRRSYPFDDAD